MRDFMAVDMLSVTRPRRLFSHAASLTTPIRNYDVGADGRFLT
jgi:hypothetical protein